MRRERLDALCAKVNALVLPSLLECRAFNVAKASSKTPQINRALETNTVADGTLSNEIGVGVWDRWSQFNLLQVNDVVRRILNRAADSIPGVEEIALQLWSPPRAASGKDKKAPEVYLVFLF